MDPAVAEIIGHPLRPVVLHASHNFRDLGGYPLADGRVTAWGVLFRADGLQRLTDDDHERFAALGLRTVLDLRTNAELDQRGKFSVDRHRAVEFVHVPILDSTWRDESTPTFEDDADFLRWAYREMLRVGGPRFAEAIRLLAKPDSLPAVFHCAAGKDRTGVLAALVLGAIGVSRELILADYALTADGIARMRAWAMAEFPELGQTMADSPSAYLAALPEALGSVLDEVCQLHGSVRAYVVSIGVSEAELDALAAALVV